MGDVNLDLSTVINEIERWRKIKLRFLLFLGFVNVIFAVVSLAWLAWYWSLLIFVVVLGVINVYSAPLMKRR